MTEVVVPFTKERQAKARGKPDLKAAAAEIAKKEPTVQSEAAQRVAEKRAARVAAQNLLPAGEADADLLTARELPLAKISHGLNPREHAAETDKSLLESVKLHGVLQPIRVRPAQDGLFTIVAGHRRYEAAKAARLKSIPVIVAVVDDEKSFAEAMVENLQREDLNPLDEAKGFQQLLEYRKAQAAKGEIEPEEASQAAVGRLVGRSQAVVANALRLLNLEPEVKEQVEAGKITGAHAKALVSLEPARQKAVALRVVEDKVTSRQVEEIVREEKDRQRQANQRAEIEKAEADKAVAAAEALLLANPKLAKDTLNVFIDRPWIRTALVEAGFKAAGTHDQVVPDPAWEGCECRATNVVYDSWRGFREACVDEAHEKAYRKQREAERQKANAEIGKKLTKARNGIAASVVSKVAGDGLSLTGQRIALYLAVTSGRGYGSDASTDAFVKRHGGAPRSQYSGDYGDVWEVIETMTTADIAKEFGHLASQRLMPNVWQEYPTSVERDWKLREYLAEQKLIEKDAVFGPKGMSDTVKRSEKERAERAKVEAEKAEQKAAVKKAEKAVVKAVEAGEPLPEPSEQEPVAETPEVPAAEAVEGETPETAPVA